MNNLPINSAKLLTLALIAIGLSACFDSDDEVIEVNVAPVAADATFITQTDTDLVASLPVSDANNDALTFAIVTDPSLGAVDLRADGTFTYMPFAEVTGTDSFSYMVSDGIANPVNATISITIEALQVSFSQFSRDAFNQAPTAMPLSVNGRTFTQDVVNQGDYQDLIDAN